MLTESFALFFHPFVHLFLQIYYFLSICVLNLYISVSNISSLFCVNTKCMVSDSVWPSVAWFEKPLDQTAHDHYLSVFSCLLGIQHTICLQYVTRFHYISVDISNCWKCELTQLSTGILHQSNMEYRTKENCLYIYTYPTYQHNSNILNIYQKGKVKNQTWKW